MSEWVSVLVVFWALWALDGFRLLPRRMFTVVGGSRPCRARVSYARLSLPGLLPTSWRTSVADLPIALSPAGVCNVAIGAAGRPAENPAQVRAWRWEEIREVAVARGLLFINGEHFCAESGIVTAKDVLALARLDPQSRGKRIETHLRLAFRPVHLRRRAHVLIGRTAWPATLNAIAFAGWIALTVYVASDIASRIPSAASDALARALPSMIFALIALHISAMAHAWSAKRRLRPVTAEKRGAALFSALLLPPQALRLRSILGDGFFPPQHPVAAVLAFGNRKSREDCAFNAIADLRWPIGPPEDPLGTEIIRWFRERMEGQLKMVLADARLDLQPLLAPPAADSPASRSYCPRCRDQFVDSRAHCPHGILLCPLERDTLRAKTS